MKNRIVGFDLARAYAIFGMFIVNFNTVFGSHTATTGLNGFLNLFNGRSSSTFVILAGMGVALMTNRDQYSALEKSVLRRKVVARSWFLFVLGLLLYSWWPADILHFYGGYMHIVALVLFVPKRVYLWVAGAVIAVFHGLFFLIPFDAGWDSTTLQYTDFWTIRGFLRNTLYNGWNPISPWLAYFLLGMWLGRLNWQQGRVRAWVFGVGAVVFGLVSAGQHWAGQQPLNPNLKLFLTANYLPPFLPFLLSTMGFALMLLLVCFEIGICFANTALMRALTATGQMTLTHYVAHLTLGIGLFWAITGHAYTGTMNEQAPESAGLVLGFSAVFFVLSVVFSLVWNRRFRHGPLETLMRTVTG